MFLAAIPACKISTLSHPDLQILQSFITADRPFDRLRPAQGRTGFVRVDRRAKEGGEIAEAVERLSPELQSVSAAKSL